MEEREKNKKILFIGLGIIVLVMLFFMIKACTGGSKKEKVNPNAITKISLKSESMTLSIGDSDKLSYTVIPSNTDETTKWVSSDDSIVSVDAMGNIKALKTGSAIVTLVAKNGVSAYTAIKVVSSTTVDGNNITASIVEKDISLKVGTTKKMLFEIDPKDTGYVEIMWESSNNVTATVDSDGLITGLRAGVTTITMKIILNDNTVLTDTATVTVEEEANLYLTSTINDIKNGEIIRASVAISDPSVTIIDGTVKVANDKTASISNVLVENNYLNFDIKGGKKGNTTLKISANTSEGKSLSLDVTINVVEFTDLYISGGDKELLIEEAFILSARLEPSVSGELDTTCTSSNKNVNVDKTSPSGEYNGACQITAVKKGKSTVTISISGQKKSVSITVVEKATTNPDNPGEKPDEKPGENPGGTPTFGVLTSLEAILSKTEYNKNEVMGSLTVNAIDAAGVKLALNSTEYSFISEFDSTTFGSKELNIAYSKDGISKTVSVPYTVKSGSSTSGGGGAGEFPGSSPSGGGGGGGGGAAGVNTETGTLTINSENKANEDGSYNGSVKLDVAINNPGENTQYVLVTYGCDDFKDAAGNVNNIACDGNRETGLKYVHAEFVNIKDGKADALLKSTTGALYYSATLYKYDGKPPLTSDDLASAEDIGKLNLTPITTLTNGETPLNITIKSDGTIPDDSDAANAVKIAIKFYKEWYAKEEDVNATISVASDSKFELRTVTINNKKQNIYGQTFRGTHSKELSVSVEVTYIGKLSNQKYTVNKYATAQIDSEGPSCTAKSINDGTGINVVVEDNKSGVESINPPKGVGNLTNSTDTLNRKSHDYTVSYAGTYTFTAEDKAGNKTTCNSVKIEAIYCYQKIECSSSKDCNRCNRAGCAPGEELHYEYGNCIGKSGAPSLKDKKFWLRVPKMNDANGGYSYDVSNTQTYTKVEKGGSYTYTCELVGGPVGSDETGKEDKYGKCGSTSANGSFQEGEKNRNCSFCGCNKWTKYEDDNIKKYDGTLSPASSDSVLEAFRISIDADGNNSKCDSVDSTYFRYKCGDGANVGSSPLSKCE